jgi:integrase/recombinase XerD
MASLYRKPVILRDPDSGEKVKTKSKKWWGQFKDANGKLKRVPLAVDKSAAQAMLNKLVKQTERAKAGLVDPSDDQRRRPLKEHIREFDNYLNHRDITSKHINETISKLKKIATDRKWTFIADITTASVLEYLGRLRRDGKSAQTYNHYLKAVKSFTRWLVRERRTPFDPLMYLSRLNVKTDRRHDRRALSVEEFRCLVDAARNGKKIEKISGPDRAMLYVLAAWTGFRRGEIGSLTLRSLRLDDDPSTATVAACFSKHRREDIQVLHPELVRQLKEWLSTKIYLKQTAPLFPISFLVMYMAAQIAKHIKCSNEI